MSRNYYAPELIHNHQRPRPQGVKHGSMNHVVNFPLTSGGVAPVPPAGRNWRKPNGGRNG